MQLDQEWKRGNLSYTFLYDDTSCHESHFYRWTSRNISGTLRDRSILRVLSRSSCILYIHGTVRIGSILFPNNQMRLPLDICSDTGDHRNWLAVVSKFPVQLIYIRTVHRTAHSNDRVYYYCLWSYPNNLNEI